MNTKTMRLPPRRVLTPSGSTSNNNKRKEREDPIDGPRPKPIPSTTTKLLKPDKPIIRLGSDPIISSASTIAGKDSEPMLSNQLLAGYLAHEYLTKGTLFGQQWVPPRENATRVNPTEEKGREEGDAKTCQRTEEQEEERERYVEVACLLKSGVAHLPGVVNPTHLARFLYL